VPTFPVAARIRALGGSDVSTGDLNGDDNPDLVITDEGHSQIDVLINATPAGSPIATFPGFYTIDVGSQPKRTRLAQIAGSAKLDLVVSSSLDSTVSVLVAQ
jgi:hypothetical protein